MHRRCSTEKSTAWPCCARRTYASSGSANWKTASISRLLVVRSSSATRLERDLPPGTSVFDAHPFTVVSLDYIKSERRREAFQRFCPEFVIVDEAHMHPGRPRPPAALSSCSRAWRENPQRHVVLLTATHSGDERLLQSAEALRKGFTQLKDLRRPRPYRPAREDRQPAPLCPAPPPRRCRVARRQHVPTT